MAQAEALYEELLETGADCSGPYEVLYDDRSESAGLKSNDADLVGLPLRLTLSRRTVAQDAVEWKPRHGEESELVPMDALMGKLEELLVPDAVGLASCWWRIAGGMINGARDQPDGVD